MKCPKCGYWNRDSFPKCFRCGEELPKADAVAKTRPKTEMPKEGAPKTYIQINEMGQATSAVDSRDQLAKEMENLLERKRRGEKEQRLLRENSAKQGFAPSARIAQTMTGRKTFPIPQNTSYIGDDNEVEGHVRPDAIPVAPRRVIGYDEEIMPEPAGGYAQSMEGRRRNKRIKVSRRGFLGRFNKILAVVLVIAALGALGYEYVYKPYMDSLNADSKKPEIEDGAIYNDWPAHIIRLPGEDGQSYWITELKKSYPVTGGWAVIEVEDYKWYEHMESLTEETVIATMTPYLVTAAGERKRMEQITFEVTVPESTLELVTPATLTTTTYRYLYEIQARVTKNSTVTVNGEDCTQLVNADGLLTYQAQIEPVGDNPFVITARAQYCRERTETIIINRPKQEIRLDLPADIATRYSSQTMKITCTTLTWATITVDSPYQNMDTTELETRGVFTFEAVFNKIGNNTIIIKASAPGYKDSIVEHDVYYVPVADVYTRKAWSMKDQYTDYLNNAEKRIMNTQIYQCDGTIVEIISKNPQMGVMELADGSGRKLLLTNNTYDTWQVGSVYRIFADAYGLYDGAPWLNARYSYIQKPKEEAAK